MIPPDPLRSAPVAQEFRSDVQALVDKLDVILPIVDGYIAFSHVRSGSQYTGPNLIAELAAVKQHLALASASASPSSETFSENETKDVLTALYQDGHVDLVLADRVAALMASVSQKQ